ncbi:tRNA (adenine(37)-N6)-methyltransferase-like [Diadema antillarum]|uniref:tRNA (adenine(37)-N6)-methyltransferase-like n=1 Tax=Diadema antillarum TaxID=105358 RepID=UPI003A85731C
MMSSNISHMTTACAEDDCPGKKPMPPNRISQASPIGHIKSCFKSKNGTPRQPTVCSYSRAKLRILKSVFPCPDHSLDGLAEFSHVWILFVFHENSKDSSSKAKVKPPRLNGRKVGVFASRSPHRPNPIGLTLARLDKVEGDTLHLSGTDMIDGTPVLDVKPYVPEYDSPKPITESPVGNQSLQATASHGEDATGINKNSSDQTHDSLSNVGTIDRTKDDYENGSSATIPPTADTTKRIGRHPPPSESGFNKLCQVQTRSASVGASSNGKMTDSGSSSTTQEGSGDDVRVADWVCTPPIKKLGVRFTPTAEQQLASFWNKGGSTHSLEFLRDYAEARQAIEEILAADPRSVYRRNSCSDRLYYFTLDLLHITSWFGRDFAEVLHIQHVAEAEVPEKSHSSKLS